MGTKLYVGNLPFNTTENELQELFSQAGAVQEVTLMQDRFTGKSRGFAFVTMSSDEEAQNAISKLNGQSIEGRSLTVNEARPREQRPPGGGQDSGQGWIRTSEGVKPADLQSAPFGHFGTYPLVRAIHIGWRRAACN